MEFVEMFKAPIKVLHPLLTATQEGNFNGTEAIGADALRRRCAGAQQRIRVAVAFATTRTTRPSSTGSTLSKCPTACAYQ